MDLPEFGLIWRALQFILTDQSSLILCSANVISQLSVVPVR